ncbi:MAG TPA: helix-turn-helix domain-containing protein [Candidatus Paceibacterota bacterium]|nr:helix-turn-helix domain-containing protein [Candidatus Paceibacterota bacterium]
MKNLQSSLEALGLTTTESRIYLAGLKNGPLTAQELARETLIKRPTVYHALSTLSQKGLVAERKENGKIRFSMASPDHLRETVRNEREELKKREAGIDALIPLLSELSPSAAGKQVEAAQYDGIEGVKAVIDEALYCRSRAWDIIAPVDNFLRDFDPAYAAYYLKTRKQRGIVSRTLWERKDSDRRLSAEDQELRNPRFMPASMEGKFKSMLILFDDKVAIISSFKKPSAVLITSKEAHAMLTALFSALWEAGEKY